ncbi:vesicle-fusing ATPase-like isoform X2 [Nicotiana tomentosiformis]|uniref:vesicle-fusing ATPase-like isoform X2 n=1 Tax=Nicotiana tomentosiformis TaxID=4098 RepID=UPI00388C4856
MTVEYDAKGTESWFLKFTVLGQPFILAYKGCLTLKKAMKLKLALARSQMANAGMYIKKTVQRATVESWSLGIQDTKDSTKISSFREFKVPKRRKWHIFNKKHIEVHGQRKVKKEVLSRDFGMEELEAEMISSGYEARGQKEVKKEVLRRYFTMKELEEEMASLGFGGPNNHFKDIILKLVLPRTLPRDLSREIRLQPIKSLIIHGPPGTGKTLVARRLAKILNAKLKVVRGPEIIGTLVGSGEKNLRDVFAPSIKDFEQMGDESPVHVIIFEEIDAIAGVDGVSRQTNLLLVGTTSRIELIDDGLLRLGRFGLRLRVDLPDEDARLKILQINSKRMQRWISFDSDIDLSAIASATQGLSIVDIEGLLQTALENALFRSSEGRHFKAEDIQIMKVDIQMALKGFGRDL